MAKPHIKSVTTQQRIEEIENAAGKDIAGKILGIDRRKKELTDTEVRRIRLVHDNIDFIENALAANSKQSKPVGRQKAAFAIKDVLTFGGTKKSMQHGSGSSKKQRQRVAWKLKLLGLPITAAEGAPYVRR